MNPIFSLILILSIFCLPQLQAKVRILTFHYNRPEFLELQIRTLQKFIQDDYELFIFNDAKSDTIRDAINEICARHSVNCLRYEQEWHHLNPVNETLRGHFQNPSIKSYLGFRYTGDVTDLPSVRHAHVIQFALDRFGYTHDDLVVILDGDMFPIRPVSIHALQENYDVIGLYRFVPKQNIGYLWVPFISLNMPRLPNKSEVKFDLALVNGMLADTGTAFYNYLKRHPGVSVKTYPNFEKSYSYRAMSNEKMRELGFTDDEISYCQELNTGLKHSRGLETEINLNPTIVDSGVEFHIDRRFLHFGGSSYGGGKVKTLSTIKFLNAIILCIDSN